MGKYGLGTSVGDTKEVGQVKQSLGRNQSGDERNWPPKFCLAQRLC
jgi:hypothetical protein